MKALGFTNKNVSKDFSLFFVLIEFFLTFEFLISSLKSQKK